MCIPASPTADWLHLDARCVTAECGERLSHVVNEVIRFHGSEAVAVLRCSAGHEQVMTVGIVSSHRARTPPPTQTGEQADRLVAHLDARSDPDEPVFCRDCDVELSDGNARSHKGSFRRVGLCRPCERTRALGYYRAGKVDA